MWSNNYNLINKSNKKKLSSKRWFVNATAGNVYKAKFKHIKKVDNRLTDYLSTEIYSNIFYDFVDRR